MTNQQVADNRLSLLILSVITLVNLVIVMNFALAGIGGAASVFSLDNLFVLAVLEGVAVLYTVLRFNRDSGALAA